MKEFIRINPTDNVLIVLRDYKRGEHILFDNLDIEVKEDIFRGHKLSLTSINKGDNIIKYGMPIGFATTDITKGSWVHTHNLKTNLKELCSYEYNQNFVDKISKFENKKVNVYKRKNGQVGIRNELWIIPTVGCVNGIAENIKNSFLKEIDELKIDDVNVLKHNYGCSQLGEDHKNTRTILQDIVKHPNAGGVLVLGLGCENNQIKEFKDTLGFYNEDRVNFLICQDVEDEIEEGKSILLSLYKKMLTDKRESDFITSINFGLECGGSDGLSGITANPLLGEFSDYVISHGGTSVLTEVPEMFGAERLLMERCKNKDIFEKYVSLINDFKTYFIKHDQEIYENPSPGNKKGGISTLEDKSLGCTQKAGVSKIIDILKYGDLLKNKGLNILNAPGNDPVATTALAAAGCQIVLFLL